MTMAWHNFAPLPAVLGGCLIGLAAALLILLNGRIAGISGIVGGLLRASGSGERAWRIAFLLGLILSPGLYGFFAKPPEVSIDAGTGTLVLAGLLVGFGTRLGSGCTSGHGVCGLARLSLRSLVATLTFMGAGVVTAIVARHLHA